MCAMKIKNKSMSSWVSGGGGVWSLERRRRTQEILFLVHQMSCFYGMLLGSNTLFDLKESIYCVQDSVNQSHQVCYTNQLSEIESNYYYCYCYYYLFLSDLFILRQQVNLEQPVRQSAGEVNSSFFFIEGVFYVNESAEVCAQLTSDLRAWALELSAAASNVERVLDSVQDEDGTHLLHYCHAARWVLGLVEREKSEEEGEEEEEEGTRPPAKKKRLTAASKTVPPEASLAAAAAAAGVQNDSAENTPAPGTTRRRHNKNKNKNKKHRIASRYVNTILNHLGGDAVSGSDSAGSVAFLPMQEARLSRLRFRIGMRYLYCHLNACEHFLYFSDVHLHTMDLAAASSRAAVSNDTVARSLYPKLLYRGRMNRRLCGVCNLWSAKCVVFDDRLAVDNPTFFCQHCYHMLHYDQEGVLLYDDFKVFPYQHDMV
jgi:hypothetical protein